MEFASPDHGISRVFRLRYIPAHADDRQAVVRLLCQSIKGITANDVVVSSLADEIVNFHALKTLYRTATIVFSSKPPIVETLLASNTKEHAVPIPGLARPLLIDHHFQGLTPLNHLSDSEHRYNCLVISGLASHPLGSWQAHGKDKSFMWVRDELPNLVPGVRFITYGYDTKLHGSKSFQTSLDLAQTLVHTMIAIGWSALSSKPILFLAHSLGGVVLKQALVILAGAGSHERALLSKIEGAILFGVPSQGMSIPDLFSMLGSQPNRALLNELSGETQYLCQLDDQFNNLSFLQRIKFFSAFETKVTPSVQACSGKFARTGPETVMVSRDSATRNLHYSDPSLTIPIDENHSDMVKFSAGDHRIVILASKMREICGLSEPASSKTSPTQNDAISKGVTHLSEREADTFPEGSRAVAWNDKAIIRSLSAPERDRRLEAIDSRLGHTFAWAFDDLSTGLSRWLQKGSGIFWINGKPASGKSTFMKFLYQDPRTFELLRADNWRSGARLLTSSFFFHHRGTSIQKSFEGLLRSLITHMLEQEKSLASLLHPILEKQYRSRLQVELRRLEAESELLEQQKNQKDRVQKKVDELKTREINLGKKLQFELETEPWSRIYLEDALQRLLQQKLFKMDLFIVVDALDEYDGTPEFIASFLHSLIQQPSTGGETSFTRTKILFSSRPWKTFIEEFASFPSIQIHEHTQTDILTYCFHSIPSSNPSIERLLASFIPEIAKRARGVFLWVKLVMRDLARTAQESAQSFGVDMMTHEIQDTLDTLPEELGQYYRVIVERLPAGMKWNTYVVLDTLCRSENKITLKLMTEILSCSLSNTLEDAQEGIRKGPVWDDLEANASRDPSRYLKMVSGGLVEIVSSGDELLLQFMHQTVKDFAISPQFKLTTLGANMGRFVRENGHSFIAKHSFAVGNLNSSFHARESEITTGFSHYEFLKTAPQSFWDSCAAHCNSLLKLAVWLGLLLCIDDACKANQHCVRYNSVDFVDVLCERIAHEDGEITPIHTQAIVDTAELLVGNGLRFETNTFGMERAVSKVSWRLNRGQPYPLVPSKGSKMDTCERLMIPLAQILPELIPSGQRPSVAGNTKPRQRRSIKTVLKKIFRKGSYDASRSIKIAAEISTRLIHRTNPALTQALLDLGVDPNTLDITGYTPADSVLTPFQEDIDLLLELNNNLHVAHQVLVVLIGRGARLRKTKESVWIQWEASCAQYGLDCSTFRVAGFPLWLPSNGQGA